MSETYPMNARCRNCGNEWDVHIPKGISVKSFEEELMCEVCGLGDIAVFKYSWRYE